MEASKHHPSMQEGQERRPRNYGAVNLTSSPHKIMEKIILRGTEKHLKVNAVIDHRQQRFERGKSCFMNLISFFMTRLPTWLTEVR